MLAESGCESGCVAKSEFSAVDAAASLASAACNLSISCAESGEIPSSINQPSKKVFGAEKNDLNKPGVCAGFAPLSVAFASVVVVCA